MKKEDRYFKWMKTRYFIYTISSILDVPILLITYYLGYHIAFWILLVLMIINSFVFVINMNRLRKLAGMKEW